MKPIPQRPVDVMLEALLAHDKLNDFERTGFASIQKKLLRPPHSITQAQSDWVRRAFDRHELESKLPALNLVSSGIVPQTRPDAPSVEVPEVLRRPLPKRPPGR